MTERFVVTSPDGSRDALYERRSALSRDLLGDSTSGTSGPSASRFRRRERSERSGRATSQRRFPELALGLVLVIGGALGAVSLSRSSTSTVEVVGVSRALARGTILTPDDFIGVRVDTQTARSFISVDDAKSLIGKIATTNFDSGTPIARGSLADAVVLNENESIVAVRVEVGDVPESIGAGDEVRVAFVPDQAYTTETTATEFATNAIVWAVTSPSEAIDDYVVSLKVPKEFLLVSATAQRTKLAIVRHAKEAVE